MKKDPKGLKGRKTISMKARRARCLACCVLSVLFVHSSPAAVIYSGLQNIAIPFGGFPVGFDGVYVDIDTGIHSSSTILGWDINPFFGGVGISGSASFQPARVSTHNESTVLKFAMNDLIDSSLTYSAGANGSSDHLGSPGNFADGVEGYLGFRFTTNNNLNTYYGWMRMTLTANTAGAFIHDWAWQDSGGDILAGDILGVPEPGRASMLAAALALLVCRRRRRWIF